jgi:hypothetical protein
MDFFVGSSRECNRGRSLASPDPPWAESAAGGSGPPRAPRRPGRSGARGIRRARGPSGRSRQPPLPLRRRRLRLALQLLHPGPSAFGRRGLQPHRGGPGVPALPGHPRPARFGRAEPQPDVPSCVRKLPALPTATSCSAPASGAPSGPPVAPSPAVFVPAPRPIVQPTAPERFRVQFTIGEQTHERLRRLQALLRREIPDGDPGAIFDRAITLLLERVEKRKLGAAARPRPPASIRPRTDRRRPDLPSA